MTEEKARADPTKVAAGSSAPPADQRADTGQGKQDASADSSLLHEGALFLPVAVTIETRKQRAVSLANREVTLMYWEIGRYIGTILQGKGRAKYGKQNVAVLSQQLVERYGKSFEHKKIVRMIKFAESFPKSETVAALSQKLSWSHFIELIPIKDEKARMYYAEDAAARNLGVREMRKQISIKAYENRESAAIRPVDTTVAPFNAFHDPHLLDTLGGKEGIGTGAEEAVLEDLKQLILELGQGLAFVEGLKRMEMNGEDFVLDLLFYHREKKTLVAIELGIGDYIPQYEKQMSFCLKWLDKYERKEGENKPVGLTLCSKGGKSGIKLVRMNKTGVATENFWPDLPPESMFEDRLKEILARVQGISEPCPCENNK